MKGIVWQNDWRLFSLWILGVALAAWGVEHFGRFGTAAAPATTYRNGGLLFRGAYEPRFASRYLMVRALFDAEPATVTYLIDGTQIWKTSEPPYDPWPSGEQPAGLGLDSISPGQHVLVVSATTTSGKLFQTGPVPITVVADVDSLFSPQLSRYPPQPSVLAEDMDTLLASTVTPGAVLTNQEVNTRRLVFGMYLNMGIDPSFDIENDQSEALVSLLPTHAAPPRPGSESLPLSMRFSVDSVFYHAIPKDWARVALPSGYIQEVQFSTAYHGDGIGFGEVVASASDPLLPVRSQWYNVGSSLRTFSFRMPRDWSSRLPTLATGDRHLIFVDPVSKTFISSYKASRNAVDGGVNGLYISSPRAFDSLGDEGGSNAAGFAELPLLVQPGEATDPVNEIPHAIGGAVARTWATRVYPATSRDAGMRTSINSCTHKGFTNTGIVPYGGIIQLDPQLDLSGLHLSLPAYRVLRAMQVYGYYVMDFGCTDLDIYTAMDANELNPYGGPWGNENGVGVQNEIQAVIRENTLYAVPAPLKR